MNINNVTRVDCFDIASYIFVILFYFLYLVHGASICLLLAALALMAKGDLTRKYCHDNCDRCFLMKLST